MGHDRLNALALLSIEAQLVQGIDYDDIIDVFARLNWLIYKQNIYYLSI